MEIGLFLKETRTNHDEYDETYLPYLQKYFKIDGIPWPTKIIYELRKENYV